MKKIFHEIGYVYRPASATDTLNLYQQICSSGSSNIDIFMIDVILKDLFFLTFCSQ